MPRFWLRQTGVTFRRARKRERRREAEREAEWKSEAFWLGYVDFELPVAPLGGHVHLLNLMCQP